MWTFRPGSPYRRSPIGRFRLVVDKGAPGNLVSFCGEGVRKISPTRFEMSVKLPKELPEEQRERLMQIVAKCPVHRTLEGEVMFEEKLELI